MATTTPNYGWSVPTSSDLVKNGATAIETLGDSIDASMAELLGGTTGQVLSKTTGTSMDFTWITPSAGGGGKLLQIQSGSTSTAVANSTNTYADTGLTVTITPSSATSKIMITSAFAYRKSSADAGNRANFRIMRGATQVFNDTDQSYTNTGIVLATNYAVTYLDSPSTTSATTYKIQIANDNNTANVEFNYNSLTFYIYATEIGA